MSLSGIAAGGEGLDSRAEEARLREPSLKLRQHDVGRDEPLVTGIVALEERHDCADPRVHDTASGHASRLCDICSRLVGAAAVRHAPNDGELVGHLRELGQKLVDADAVHVRGDGLIERAGVVGT